MSIRRPLFLAAMVLSFLGSGCLSVVSSVATNHPIPPTWTVVADGVERMSVESTSVSSTHILLYAFDPAKFLFAYEYSTSSKSVIDWKEAHPEAVAVLNGSYFNLDQSPSGMLIHAGQRVGKRSFDLDKSAVLELSPRATIQDGLRELPLAKDEPEAAQSYPILVQDGQARISTESGQVARRTFAAVRADKYIIFGVVDDGAITLYQLSHELAQAPLQITTALNLDGGPSTGISVMTAAGEENMNSITPVPMSIVVTRK